jgi:hypothetical protein
MVDYFIVKTHDIWEGNVITRSEIEIENLCCLGFQEIREGMTLKRLELQSLECIWKALLFEF